MNGWAIFVTGWILVSMTLRVALQPKRSRLLNHTPSQLVGALVGNIIWGLGLVFSLYMAGLYE